MAFASFTAFTLVFVSYIFVAAQGDVVQATPFDLGKTYKDVQKRPASSPSSSGGSKRVNKIFATRPSTT